MKNLVCKFLITLLLCNQIYAIDVSEFGISIILQSILSHERNVTLIMPDAKGTKIVADKQMKLKTPINQKPLKIQAQIENKPPFTKILISQAEDQYVTAHFYFTMTPTKEMLPIRTAQIGFRYQKLDEVVPNTTTTTGHVDLIAYKQKNFISVTIDIFGKGSVNINRDGDWIILLKPTDTTEPWKKMSIKNVLNAQRQPLQTSSGATKVASDAQLIDQLIMNNKIDKVEIDPNNTVVLLAA